MVVNDCTLLMCLLQLQEYLVASILPYISKGVVDIARSRPEDPVQHMIDHLLLVADSIEANARDEAYERFHSELQNAEASKAQYY